MTVDLDLARSIGLTAEHHGVVYAFCAKGCKLDFLDSPTAYGAAPVEGEAVVEPRLEVARGRQLE